MKGYAALVLVALCSFMTCGVGFAKDGGSAAAAAGYPVKPVHLIVPYPAGGGADYWARLVAAQLAAELGQPVVVDNIPGAGGNKGTTAAAAASPDGYTLLLGSIGPLAVHPYTYTTLAFDPVKSFVPIALLESSPILLVANYELRIWTGVLAPAGTPKAIVAKLNRFIQAMLRSPELKKEITDEGGEAGAMTPAGFASFLRSERKRWNGLVVESGVSKVL